MHIICLKKSNPPIMYTSKKKKNLTVFTYCYLSMHGYRASIGAWVPQSPHSVVCIYVGIEPSIGAWVHLVPFGCAWVQGHLPEQR